MQLALLSKQNKEKEIKNREAKILEKERLEKIMSMSSVQEWILHNGKDITEKKIGDILWNTIKKDWFLYTHKLVRNEKKWVLEPTYKRVSYKYYCEFLT